MTDSAQPALRYLVIVNAAPQSSEAAHSAYRFATALLDQGHSIEQLFFYGDGAHNASAVTVMPQDEPNLPALWHALIEEHAITSTACVSSAIRRGILGESARKRVWLNPMTCTPTSGIGGHGQLLAALDSAERVISFG